MPSRGVEADGQFVQFSCGSLLSTNVPAASALRDVVIDAWSNVTNSLSYTSISQHNRAGSNQRGQTRTEDHGPTIEDAFTSYYLPIIYHHTPDQRRHVSS